jgi:cytochrome P450
VVRVERPWANGDAGPFLDDFTSARRGELGPGLPRFSPHDVAVQQRPYSVYAYYRRHDPVHWGEPYAPGRQGCWYLFRHEHVVALLRDRRFQRKVPGPQPADGGTQAPEEHRQYLEVLDRLLLSTDPPAHRRLRTLVSQAFTARAVQGYRPLVQRVADELIDGLARPARFDLIEEFAVPLSWRVITAVLGLPRDAIGDLRTWITQFGDGLDLRKEQKVLVAASSGTAKLLEYFAGVLAERRKHSRDDLITALLNARDNNHRLSEDELLAMLVQLIFAGHDTTVGQIGATILNLLDNPKQLAVLQRNPALISAAVSESLRYSGSVHTAAARKPIEDVQLGDKMIRAGQSVIAFIAAANRDPDVFPDPDRFDINRDTTTAVPFGAGIHHCLGASLARLESEAAVATLLRRLPTLERTPRSAPRYRANVVLPGIAHLDVRERLE